MSLISIIVNNGNYTNKDLYAIFQPYSSGTQTPTNYRVNNQSFANQDLSQIFQIYSSGTKANPTGIIVNNSNYINKDLADVFAPITLGPPTFTFTQGTQPTIQTLTV
jgi:hypothetical protein